MPPCGKPKMTEEELKIHLQKRLPPKDKSICQRCRKGKSLYIVRSVTFCRPCFETAVQSRLVRVLHPPLHPPEARAKSGQLRPNLANGHVLLALSGGAGSTAMLDLMTMRGYIGRPGEVRDPRKGERSIVWKKGWVVHVDFSAVTGVESRTDMLRIMAEERGLEFVDLKAEEVFDPSLKQRLRRLGRVEATPGSTEAVAVSVKLDETDLPLLSTPTSSTATPLESLNALLSSLPPPSRPAILAHILDSLLALTARTLPDIEHLLVGETSTREAQRVISGTATGRGWALPLELAAVRPIPDAADSPKSENQLLRIKPMKELSLKEAAFWCHGRGLYTLNERRWDSTGGGVRNNARGKGATGSIEALTERFIATLNSTHPSTVNTVNRTGDKLLFTGGNGVNDTSLPLCPVCELPVDPPALEWKARAALTSLPGRGPAADATASNPGPDDQRSALAPLLCYACLTAFTPLTAAQRDKPQAEPVALPLWVGERTARVAPAPESELRSRIAEFIIGDE